METLGTTGTLLTGIFAGKRTSSAHDREYGGGVIQVQNSVFEDNYVDIMFSEWCWAGICNCNNLDGQKFHSSITNNFFNGLADDYYCNDYVDVTLNYYQNWYIANAYQCSYPSKYVQTFPPVPTRCHIIDLSPYLDIWVYLGGITCNLVCPRAHWANGVSTNVTSNNTYTEPCSTNAPHDEFH